VTTYQWPTKIDYTIIIAVVCWP